MTVLDFDPERESSREINRHAIRLDHPYRKGETRGFSAAN